MFTTEIIALSGPQVAKPLKISRSWVTRPD